MQLEGVSVSSASSEGRSTRRYVLRGRVLRGVLLATLVSLGVGAPGASRALTVMDGQALEVAFAFSAPPLVGGVSPVEVLLVDPVVTASGVTGWDVELWDGSSHLGTSSTGPTADPWAFTTAASAWETNAVEVDLTSVIDGSIDGRVRVIPRFAPSAVAASVEIDFFPPPGRGLKAGIGSTDPVLSFASASPLPELQGAPRVVAVTEPVTGLLLAPPALLWARRGLRR
jgi:hypothetical protein